MSELNLEIPGTIVFGLDSIARLSAAVGRFGTRCLVVSESVMHDGRYIERVRDLLDKRGISCIVYDELPPGSGSSVIDEVAKIARVSQTQCIVGLGGMRVLATARCAAVAAGSKIGVAELFGSRSREGLSALPYIEVPSSCRNHFMVKNQCVITHSGTREAKLIKLPGDLVKAVLVDPKIGLSQSAKYNAAAMLDTLLAAIESYVSNQATFLSDPTSLQAVEILGTSILGAFRSPSDVRPRVRASEAGLLCALSLSSSSQGVGGALAYTINSRFSIPKSWIATVLLPHILDRYLDVQSEKMAKVAAAMGEDIEGLPPGDAAARAPVAVRRYLGAVGLPTRLRDFDLSLDDMVEVSELAYGMEFTHTSPVTLSTQDVYEIVKAAF